MVIRNVILVSGSVIQASYLLLFIVVLTVLQSQYSVRGQEGPLTEAEISHWSACSAVELLM